MDDHIFTLCLLILAIACALSTFGSSVALHTHHNWATICMTFGSLMLSLFTLIVGYAYLSQEYFNNYVSLGESWGLLTILSLGGFILLGIGTFSFCARFGATAKRIQQLETLAAALSAAKEHQNQQTVPSQNP
ncbi:MAG: hypothetical protein AAGC74_06160 [Verrucomicrobiota bacterium]